MEKEEMKTIKEMKNSIKEAEIFPEKSESSGSPKEAAESVDTVPVSDDIFDVNKLEKRLKEAEELGKEITDKYQRVLAEFDNFRKRTSKEKASIYSDGACDIIKQLLPVIDSFDRAAATITEAESDAPAYAGLSLIYKQLRQFMEQAGIAEIEDVGKQFDPTLHQALSHTDDPAFGENEIIEALQKGYVYKDKIIRHSMVKVAN